VREILGLIFRGCRKAGGSDEKRGKEGGGDRYIAINAQNEQNNISSVPT
jgi:hypothetical protein